MQNVFPLYELTIKLLLLLLYEVLLTNNSNVFITFASSLDFACKPALCFINTTTYASIIMTVQTNYCKINMWLLTFTNDCLLAMEEANRRQLVTNCSNAMVSPAPALNDS